MHLGHLLVDGRGLPNTRQVSAVLGGHRRFWIVLNWVFHIVERRYERDGIFIELHHRDIVYLGPELLVPGDVRHTAQERSWTRTRLGLELWACSAKSCHVELDLQAKYG